VAPDNLSRGVLLEPLRAGIPARNPAFRIEHEDRVIFDAFDEQPKHFRVFVWQWIFHFAGTRDHRLTQNA
jgi:hypothetical protein